MKRLVFLAFFALAASVAIASTMTVEELRLKYIKAVESSEAADELHSLLSSAGTNDAFKLAYLGAAEALIAKHSWNPYTKIQFLNRSQETLARAIAKAPADPEIRFLRFSIQHYVPSYLGYSGNLEEDRIAIVNNLSKAQGEVRKVIVRFMMECGRCTASELKVIKNYA